MATPGEKWSQRGTWCGTKNLFAVALFPSRLLWSPVFCMKMPTYLQIIAIYSPRGRETMKSACSPETRTVPLQSKSFTLCNIDTTFTLMVKFSVCISYWFAMERVAHGSILNTIKEYYVISGIKWLKNTDPGFVWRIHFDCFPRFFFFVFFLVWSSWFSWHFTNRPRKPMCNRHKQSTHSFPVYR